MTKTKLLGGIIGMVITLGLVTPAHAMPMPSEQVYAKSAPTATVSTVQSREHRASRSDKAKDMSGYRQSLYRGYWYDSRYEDSRKCIMKRESHYNYRAANSSSSARGAYQFLDNSWRDSLVWMMLKESNKTDDGLKKEIKALRSKPIHHWSRYFQDRAFFTAWQHGKGKHHWYHGSIRCI